MIKNYKTTEAMNVFLTRVNCTTKQYEGEGTLLYKKLPL